MNQRDVFPAVFLLRIYGTWSHRLTHRTRFDDKFLETDLNYKVKCLLNLFTYLFLPLRHKNFLLTQLHYWLEGSILYRQRYTWGCLAGGLCSTAITLANTTIITCERSSTSFRAVAIDDCRSVEPSDLV